MHRRNLQLENMISIENGQPPAHCISARYLLSQNTPLPVEALQQKVLTHPGCGDGRGHGEAKGALQNTSHIVTGDGPKILTHPGCGDGRGHGEGKGALQNTSHITTGDGPRILTHPGC